MKKKGVLFSELVLVQATEAQMYLFEVGECYRDMNIHGIMVAWQGALHKKVFASNKEVLEKTLHVEEYAFVDDQNGHLFDRLKLSVVTHLHEVLEPLGEKALYTNGTDCLERIVSHLESRKGSWQDKRILQGTDVVKFVAPENA